MNSQDDFKPYIPASKVTPELTVTSVVMGILLSVVFGAANAYLGLRVGLTVSASIPAAVIAMGMIRIIMRRNSILESNIEPDKYEYTDSGMLMPQQEVEEKFTSLFGTEVKWNHCTVDGGGIYFSYSETEEAYVIPITGVTPIYTPKVIDVTQTPSTVILKVGYLASTDWVQDSEGNMVPPEAAKYMKITLGKNSDDSFYIRAIQASD